MSTFGGLLDEIKHISIDRFDGDNLQSKVFFLSHCHTDHMVGLKQLQRDGLPGPLYVSQVSSVIVKRQFPQIKDIKCIDIGVPTIVPILSTENFEVGFRECVVVTAIPAGHCPGSIMFLFEQNDKKILYTGDFRLPLTTLQAIRVLKPFANDDMSLDAAYIDSTFLSVKFPYFPTQRESVDATIRLIDDWLRQSKRNVIVIRPPALYGYEYMFKEIVDRFNQKIHMTQETINDYQYVPELDDCFHRGPKSDARIHLCKSRECTDDTYRWSSTSLACMPDVEAKYIRIIRPTAQRWENLHAKEEIVALHESKPNINFVCYSNHSSYYEIVDLLKYLKPKTVKLNVEPGDWNVRMEMRMCLKNIIEQYQVGCEKNDNEEQTAAEILMSFKNIPIADNCTVPRENMYLGDQDLVVEYPILKKRKRC